jgi:hypothetical protein
MRSEEELEEQLGWLFSAAVERDEVAEYVLGFRPYVVDGREIERFYRLHEVINWLATFPPAQRETQTLHLAAAIAATDRELAALVTAGVADHTDEEGWQPLSDAAYFAVAVRHANLCDYLAMRGNYVVPMWMQGSNPHVRRERVCRLYAETTLGHVRHGLRLVLVSLLDGPMEQRMIALQACRQLAMDDPVLRAKVRQRLLVAVQSGELAEIGKGSDELAAFIIATLGHWRVAEALPFLEEMARTNKLDAPSGSRTSVALTQTLAVLGHSLA